MVGVEEELVDATVLDDVDLLADVDEEEPVGVVDAGTDDPVGDSDDEAAELAVFPLVVVSTAIASPSEAPLASAT